MCIEPSQIADLGGIMLNSFSNTAGQPPRRWNYAEQKQGVMGSRPHCKTLPAAAGRIGGRSLRRAARQVPMFDETLPGRTGDKPTRPQAHEGRLACHRKPDTLDGGDSIYPPYASQSFQQKET